MRVELAIPAEPPRRRGFGQALHFAQSRTLASELTAFLASCRGWKGPSQRPLDVLAAAVRHLQ